jgi:CheY-like chemotaxis protein
MHILFVDDHEMNRRVVRGMLEIAGISMDEASGAECGLRMIDTEDYDIILMDYQMPEMDGYELARHLRTMGHQGPMVALTANAFSEDRDRCLAAGLDDYLAKPFHKSDLAALLARWHSPAGDKAA